LKLESGSRNGRAGLLLRRVVRVCGRSHDRSRNEGLYSRRRRGSRQQAARRLWNQSSGSGCFFRGIPDEFPLLIFSIALVKADRLTVNLAAHTNQLSAKNRAVRRRGALNGLLGRYRGWGKRCLACVIWVCGRALSRRGLRRLGGGRLARHRWRAACRCCPGLSRGSQSGTSLSSSAGRGA